MKDAQMVKRLLAMRETWVRSQEDPLEKEMATHSDPLALFFFNKDPCDYFLFISVIQNNYSIPRSLT